jgi:hypothetical protein
MVGRVELATVTVRDPTASPFRLDASNVCVELCKRLNRVGLDRGHDVDVGIDRGERRRVTEALLDRFNVGAGLEEMPSEPVKTALN